MPERWTCEVTWAWLRRFHSAGAAVLAATPTLGSELATRGFKNVKLWPRGVDADLFRPRKRGALDLPRPIFLTVGRRGGREKSRSLSQARSARHQTRRRRRAGAGLAGQAVPEAVFLGSREGEALAEIYAAADVFVFPSRTDTFGLVLLEALASGVPVAGFPGGGAARRDRRGAGRRAG